MRYGDERAGGSPPYLTRVQRVNDVRFALDKSQDIVATRAKTSGDAEEGGAAKEDGDDPRSDRALLIVGLIIRCIFIAAGDGAR